MIVDYKSSDVTDQKKADQRAKESLQLKIYALAQYEMTGRLPARVELRFLESGLVGRHTPTDLDLAKAREAIVEAARGIRRREFEATPELPGLPLLSVQPDLPEHRDAGVRGDAMKLSANGIDINYEIEGEGPVVTFSHSLACNLSMWDEQARALGAATACSATTRAATGRPARPPAPTRSISSPTT